MFAARPRIPLVSGWTKPVRYYRGLIISTYTILGVPYYIYGLMIGP